MGPYRRRFLPDHRLDAPEDKTEHVVVLAILCFLSAIGAVGPLLRGVSYDGQTTIALFLMAGSGIALVRELLLARAASRIDSSRGR